MKKQSTAGKLFSRPTNPTEASSLGLQPLALDNDRDGLLYVPQGYQITRPAPFILMLHGAGGNAEGGLQPFRSLADTYGAILLAVDSRQQTWDVIRNQYGPDISFLDRALTFTFSRYAIDPAQIAIEGFSDGASYALSVGMMNGDLFTHVIAFSPGFIAPSRQEGTPRIFISHGIHDSVLPIDRCSRKIEPQLKQIGYEVHYREFDGPHTVPTPIAREALDWFIEKSPKNAGSASGRE